MKNVAKLKLEPRMESGILSSAKRISEVMKSLLKPLEVITCLSQASRSTQVKMTVKILKMRKRKKVATLLLQTPRSDSTLALANSQPTTETTHIHAPMHLSLEAENSPIPTKVLANGGKSNSIKDTGLTELEFLTEETAVAKDSIRQRFLLATTCADLLVAEEMANGIQSSALNQSMEEKLDS